MASFTVINQTQENILLAFISSIFESNSYAWKVVAPSQDSPFVQDIPDQVELLTNYYLSDGNDPYGGQQSNSVFWGNDNSKAATYKALWNEAENKVEVTLTDDPRAPEGIALENYSERLLYIHPKFGTNEIIPPIRLLFGSTAFYNFRAPMTVAVVESYSQYSPPNGELYEVQNLLSNQVKMDADQTATITGSKEAGYTIVMS